MILLLIICKAKKSNEFLNDYILYQLNISNPFEEEKYQKLKDYILDFMVGGDAFIDFFLKFFSFGKNPIVASKLLHLFLVIL